MPGIDEPLLRLSPEEREEVQKALRRENLSPPVRERLEMVKATDFEEVGGNEHLRHEGA